MGRYTFPAYNRSPTPSYVVVWDMHWHVLECERLEPAADLSGAMTAAIERLAGEGWKAEATPEYGFVFVRRETERRVAGVDAARSLRHAAAVVLAVSIMRSEVRGSRRANKKGREYCF